MGDTLQELGRTHPLPFSLKAPKLFSNEAPSVKMKESCRHIPGLRVFLVYDNGGWLRVGNIWRRRRVPWRGAVVTPGAGPAAAVVAATASAPAYHAKKKIKYPYSKCTSVKVH